MKSNTSTGYIYAGIAACTFAIYLLINRYVYLTYRPPIINYVSTFMVAAALFAGISLLLQRITRRNPKRKQIGLVALNGIIAGTGVAMIIVGQNFTTAINASILITLVILTTAIFAKLIHKEELPKSTPIWLVLLFVGFYLAIVGLGTVNLNRGDLIIILALIFLGFSNAFSRNLVKNNDSRFVSDARIVVGGAAFAIVGLIITRGNFLVTDAYWWPLLSGFSFWITIKFFYSAIGLIGSNRATIISNTHPVLTAVFGALLLSEAYTVHKLIGTVLIILSVYMINTRKPNGARELTKR